MQLIPQLFNQQTFFSKHSKLERASHWSQSLSGKDDHPWVADLFPRWLGKRWVYIFCNKMRITKLFFRLLLRWNKIHEKKTRCLWTNSTKGESQYVWTLAAKLINWALVETLCFTLFKKVSSKSTHCNFRFPCPKAGLTLQQEKHLLRWFFKDWNRKQFSFHLYVD